MKNRDPVIWQLSVVQFELGTSISGVALAKIDPSTYPDRFFSDQTVAVLKSYMNKPYAGEDLFIWADRSVYKVITNPHGTFKFWLNSARVNEVEIYADAACTAIVPRVQSSPIYYPLGEKPIEIISDIDDTIIQSFSNTFLQRISTILFKQIHSREMIAFTGHLLTNARERGIRVYCISRSEENLFHLLTKILSFNHVSGAIIYLFDYLSYLGLLTARKQHFKFEQISSILQKSPGKRYYLIGDDIQNDIRIYTEIAERFPGRICQVLVHKTKAQNSQFQKFYHGRLLGLNVPVMYFDDRTPFDSSLLVT
jgi:phosphatidate phosphatase APP1